MTTQLEQDLEQAVIDYLQIKVIEHNDQPWEYVHKGIKHKCEGRSLDYIISDMFDGATPQKYLVTEDEALACVSLISSNSVLFYGTTEDSCLKLALEIMPKYIRDNLMLSLTLYKLTKGEDGDFHSFLEYNVYQEFEVTKELFYKRFDLQELTDFDGISEDSSVDRIIKLTFPGIQLTPVLDVEATTEDSEPSEMEDEGHWDWVKQQFDKRIAFEKFIPEAIKEQGHSYLKIWEYLRNNQEKWFTANQLAEQFECTPQWIRDAIGTMRKQGIDIFGHTRKGYILRTSVVDQLFADSQNKGV